MFKNQKYQCKNSVIEQMHSIEKWDARFKQRKKVMIEELTSRKARFIKTRSDNTHERKTIEQKKQKSLINVPKEDSTIEQSFNEYDRHNRPPNQNQPQERILTNLKTHQYPRDVNSFQINEQMISHDESYKSRYKQTKQKTKDLIKKMITTSKTNLQSISNKMKNKIIEIKTQVSNDKISSDQYQIPPKSPQKLIKTLRSSYFSPKIEKCSTFNFETKQKNQIEARLQAAAPSKNNQSNFSKLSIPLSSKKITNKMVQNQKKTAKLSPQIAPFSQKMLPAIKTIINFEKQKKKVQFSAFKHLLEESSERHIPTVKSINTVITSKSEDSKYDNPLVLKQKHLFSEYASDEYTKIRTQKEIIEETENAVKEVSKKLTISRKQSQKLITRARQKNKKFVAKLKGIGGRGEQMKNSPIKVLENNKKRHYKIRQQIAKQINNSFAIQSHFDDNLSSRLSQQPEDNFLGLNSKNQSDSVLAFNEEIRQRILIHLETIKAIADYAQGFAKIYQDCNEWGDLVFLFYKKYYIERYKIYHVLKSSKAKFDDGTIFQESPFTLEFCQVSMQEIKVFRESKEELSIQLDLQVSNAKIKKVLRELYNKFIQKSGDNPAMNMLQTDDFSESILQDLDEQISILVESCGNSQKIKRRINEAIQVGLIIAHLQGYISKQIEEVVVGELDGQKYFEKFYSKFLELFQN